MHRSLYVVLPLFVLLGCGPGGERSVRGERIPIVEESGWRVDDVSVSPDGRWVAVALVSEKKPAFRFFVLDLDRGIATEAKASWAARGQLLARDRPGTRALEWTNDGRSLRFPAGLVGASRLMPNFQTGVARREPGVVTGSRSWFTVSIEGDRVGALELDDSREALDTKALKPDDVDLRLGLRTFSKSEFALLDLENGAQEIGRFRGGMMWLHLGTATVSDDGKWIGVTVGREAFGSHGRRGFVVNRGSGERTELGDDIHGPLRFHPVRREVYGISEAFSSRGADLIRWRF